ncbi:hypothetical protein [Silvibacterium dinghuense]|uniref:Uncharacterized protein n=1 Tax=Silvibacterium dinghuense TaxID=1560006 RepID=A0A4Q1S7M7_9BACT|nr:hypothetical protein [Silvibacterium dinghuense]RXS92800.1 hypothetical protein ESZ00_19920 [Silvibacterium dinghuense]GGH17520.1 hypothetical protein GCM10011586_40080 [Silvibacterium dinghuense]
MSAKNEPSKGFSHDMQAERVQPQPDHPIRAIELFAWLGVDELHSGEIGLKQVWAPGAKIPLVAVKRYTMEAPAIVDAMQRQAKVYGKKIRLCRFVFAEVVSETPAGEDKP